MATITRFEEIIAWKEARKISMQLQQLINAGRFRNNYRLINQIEGSSGSVMDNIAEGFERNGRNEFVQFLYIAKGSCGELRSQLYRVTDAGYISHEEFNELHANVERVGGLLQGLISYLKSSTFKGPKFQNRK